MHLIELVILRIIYLVLLKVRVFIEKVVCDGVVRHLACLIVAVKSASTVHSKQVSLEMLTRIHASAEISSAKNRLLIARIVHTIDVYLTSSEAEPVLRRKCTLVDVAD